MTGLNRKNHGGLGFDLWTNRGAWFWRLAGRCLDDRFGFERK